MVPVYPLSIFAHGLGKTQLAVEYAHRFASSYEVVWWIAAEQAERIGAQFAALTDALGYPQPGRGQAELRRAVFAELQARGLWLLVFDNAEDPELLTGWLPGGGGHVLITSRTHRWAEVAVRVEVDVLTRVESVALLRTRMPALRAADADQVADAVGDLPLALAQAAGYMAGTGIPARDYADLLRTRAAEVLDQGRPISYPRSLAAVTRLAYDRLRGEDLAAAEVTALCAFLAPEPIPAEWFTGAAAELPVPLGERVADPLTWHLTLDRIGQQALARIGDNALQMHRLTQAILRSQQSPGQAKTTRSQAESLLAASHPGNPQDPRSWPGWSRMLPHLLALDPADTDNKDVRALACGAAWYLGWRGDPRASRDLADSLYQRWRSRHGPDDLDTLHAAYILSFALRELGNLRQSRDLIEENLSRRHRLLGEDHIDTIRSATALAERLRLLGDARAARDLDEEILARSRQALGEDHPQTLGLASNLAADLRHLGQPQAAREIEEETLPRRRRVLGEDHPDTLLSAMNLAAALRALGQAQGARDLDEDTLARYRRVLGDDHLDTLECANNLAADLRALGQAQAARDLDEDTLARYRRVLGEDHPDTLRSARNLAADLSALEDD